MNLNQISDRPGARAPRKRIGRGIGSGTGKTGGRGVKGQKSRKGVAIKGFEGGQMPIHRRLPKRGFHNPSAKRYAEVGLDDLQTAVDAGKIDANSVVTANALKAAGVITHARDGVRILGNGELKAKLNLDVSGATRSATAAIEAAGGSIKVAHVAGSREKRPPKGSRGRKMLRPGAKAASEPAAEGAGESA
jgi:large subunit ribosomal protein L15